MQYIYLLALLVIIGCLILVDRRYKLAFFYKAQQTIMTLALSIWLFIVWDIFGIKLGIFYHGDSQITLPIRIIPEFPLEELFFLFVLTYSALLLYRYFSIRRGV